MSIESTLVLVKPDGLKRRLTGEIIQRLERKGLNIVAMKMLKLTKEQAEVHYSVHKGKPFFPGLVEFITSDPLIAMVVKGHSAISVVRNLVGATDGAKASPGTIRGDFAITIDKSVIHASDSVESFEHEWPIYFSTDEILDFSYGDEELF